MKLIVSSDIHLINTLQPNSFDPMLNSSGIEINNNEEATQFQNLRHLFTRTLHFVNSWLGFALGASHFEL